MSRFVEALVPSRLGSSFRWLLASSWVSSLGDGFALAAGPLLLASETRDASLVALAPAGAALFVAGRSLPFIGQAVLVSAGALLVARIRLPAREQAVKARGVRREVAEGFRWVRHNAAVRTLVLTIFTFNITFGAAWSVLVLYAKERLGMGAVGFGLLTAAAAIGGVLGTLSYGSITRRVSLGNVMRVGLVIETFTHLSLALTTTPALALAVMVVFGAHAFVWGTTSVTVRQRAVPETLQGRVSSVNGIGVYGGLVLGAALGGPIADRWGIAAPFWFAFAGSALFVAVMWRQLAHIAHQDGSATAGTPSRTG